MPYTVSRITKYIKDIVDEDVILSNVSIIGEVSDFKLHSSGHLYFTLKDELSAISCIMFSSNTDNIDIMPENGSKVCVGGYVSIYEKTGRYNLYALSIESAGKGSIQQDFERLKAKLESKGRFDRKYKKPIPPYPKCIAVIASPTGAAVRDVINISKMRSPSVKVVVISALVQGDNAPESIANAIRTANSKIKPDTIILARGGGSREDLNAFNSELVAESIFYSAIPVISAIGHETDFTIADFVADKRASTPSAAAQAAVPSDDNERQRLSIQKKRLVNAFSAKLYSFNSRYEVCRLSLKGFLSRMEMKNARKRQLSENLDKSIKALISKKHSYFASMLVRLDSASPVNTLKRGYCKAFRDGCVVKSVDDAEMGDRLSLTLSDGIIYAEVIDKYGKENI